MLEAVKDTSPPHSNPHPHSRARHPWGSPRRHPRTWLRHDQEPGALGSSLPGCRLRAASGGGQDQGRLGPFPLLTSHCSAEDAGTPACSPPPRSTSGPRGSHQSAPGPHRGAQTPVQNRHNPPEHCPETQHRPGRPCSGSRRPQMPSALRPRGRHSSSNRTCSCPCIAFQLPPSGCQDPHQMAALPLRNPLSKSPPGP